jgi:pyrroloquinoline quinone biosynthesis protein D
MIAARDVAFLPRGVRTHRDKVRASDMLLGPERVLVLDQIGLAILSRLDGVASVAEIAEDLAQTFAAPRDVIEPDVIEYLTDLRDKGFVHVRQD